MNFPNHLQWTKKVETSQQKNKTIGVERRISNIEDGGESGAAGGVRRGGGGGAAAPHRQPPRRGPGQQAGF